MRKSLKIKKKIFNYFFDHPIQKRIYNYSITLVISAFSAAIFSFGFSTFVSTYTEESLSLATGGFSGLTQSIALIIASFGHTGLTLYTLQSILYFVVNVPAILFAFFKIGRRFTITTAVNVGLTSLFISLFSASGFIQEIANNVFIVSSPLTRVLFAGICTGVSSGIALKAGSSCGGMDIVSCYFSVRKSTGVGKYNIIANSIVIVFYFVVNLVVYPGKYIETCLIVPYAIVYFLASSLVIDSIHIRNKKIAVEIITKNDYITDVLINIFPHSATIFEARGAYSGSSEHVVKMLVSSYEAKKVVKIVRKIDSNAFITLTPIQQVYGNFFINPIE